MQIVYFFNGSWLLQLVVGAGLFFCSFFFEYQILRAFIAPEPMALFLAVTLEIGKVVAIIWHYYLTHLSDCRYPFTIRFFSLFFRLGLVLLSLLCSLLYLTERLDRPNLEKVKAVEIKKIDQELQQELSATHSLYQKNKKERIERNQKEILHVRQRHEETLTALETLLLQEMDNVVGATFKGPRYAEFSRRLQEEKAAWESTLQQTTARHVQEINALDQSERAAQRRLLSEAREAREQIQHKDYADDERVSDPHIAALLLLSNILFRQSFHPMQFTFLFSILLSMLMETGIMLAFANITVALAPALQVQHTGNLEQEILRSKIAGRSIRENMKHRAAMQKIFLAGKRSLEKARGHFSQLY